MDLPTIEKDITVLVVRRFIEAYAPTNQKEIFVQFKPHGVGAVHRLIGINVLRDVDNERVIPKPVAFSMCGRRESQLQAKSAFEMVIPYLQRLYENTPHGIQPTTSMLENDLKTLFPDISQTVMWLGLYQCFEMGLVGGWSWEKKDAEQVLRINAGTMSVDVRTYWDKYIQKHTRMVESSLINAVARKFLHGMAELSQGRAGTGIVPLKWVELAKSLGLNDDDRNLIVRYLMQENLLAKKGASDVLTLTREAVESLSSQLLPFELQESDEMPSPSESSAATNRSGLLVLISHSSKDAALASALIDLLRSALGLLPTQIRCSSVDGYRLPAGVHSDTQLREEVNVSRVLIGLITPNSLASPYVLFELGARWGAGETMVPLLAGVSANDLRGPLSGFNALLCSSEEQLHQAMGEIGGHLGLGVQNPAAYLKQLRPVMEETAKLQPHSATTSSSAVRPVEEKKLRLSLAVTNTPPASQTLKMQANQTVKAVRLDYLLSTGACLASDALSLEGQSFEVPIDDRQVVKLYNTPRSDMNRSDHSGPAKLRLVLIMDGLQTPYVVPVQMDSVYHQSTNYIKLSGSEMF